MLGFWCPTTQLQLLQVVRDPKYRIWIAEYLEPWCANVDLSGTEVAVIHISPLCFVFPTTRSLRRVYDNSEQALSFSATSILVPYVLTFWRGVEWSGRWCPGQRAVLDSSSPAE